MSMWCGLVNNAVRRREDAELNLIPLIDIMSVMVSFLLIYTANVEVVQNAQGIEIPQSLAEVQPKQAVVVMISKEQLFVQGEPVATVAEIRGTSGALIEPLRQVLDRPLSDSEAAQQAAAATETREITVIADKSLPFDVVKKVIATCTGANYGKVSLAVLERAGLTPARSSST